MKEGTGTPCRAAAVAANDADTALRAMLQLMEDARSGRIMDLNVDPGSTGSRRWDAFCAAAVASVASSLALPTPEWTLEPSRFLDAPWFPSEDILGRPLSVPIAGYLLANAPSEFNARGVLVDADTLTPPTAVHDSSLAGRTSPRSCGALLPRGGRCTEGVGHTGRHRRR